MCAVANQSLLPHFGGGDACGGSLTDGRACQGVGNV